MSKETRKGEDIHIDIDLDSPSDNVKKRAGDFAKAAGGLAGSLGKLAVKKGTEIKGKIEDEEIKEKTVTKVKSASNKAAKVAVSASEKAKKTVLRNTTDVSADNMEQAENVEVTHPKESDVNKSSKGLGASIGKRQEQRAEKKAEQKRKKEEERKKSQKMGFLLLGIVILLCVGIYVLGGNEEKATEDATTVVDEHLEKTTEDSTTIVDEHEGQIQPPMSSEDAYLSERNYKSIKQEFENAGFKNITVVGEQNYVSDLFSTVGAVKDVTINGNSFDAESWFDPEDEVVISYETYQSFDIYKREGAYKEEDERVVDPDDYKKLESFIGEKYQDVSDSVKKLGYTPFYVTDLLHVEVTDHDPSYTDYYIKDIIYVESEDLIVVYQVSGD